MLPVSNTAFFCCGIRMDDNLSDSPLIGDEYSHFFMSDQGLKVHDKFKNKKHANRNILIRHKLIDEVVSEILSESDDVTFISVGSGLESRAYRAGGGSWVEIDEHQVISFKETCLPQDQCKNDLLRLGVDFTNDELKKALSTIKVKSKVVVIVEGVFVYLEQSQISNTLSALRDTFGSHLIVTDFISEKFIEKYSKRFDEEVNDLGAYYSPLKKPISPFLECGYELIKEQSVTAVSIEIYGNKIIRYLANVFAPSFIDGYKVALLTHKAEGRSNALTI